MSESRRQRRRLDYSLRPETYVSNSNAVGMFSSRRSTLFHTSTSDTSLYKDSGDCGCVCEHCNAFFWFEERCVSASVNRYPRYTQCCRGGIVKLPFVRTYSPIIVQLFSHDDFLANIRAYNSMFSMTSFGAKIDDSVNHGIGPYVFKIEGQVHHWIGSLCPPANERPRFLQMYVYDTANEVSNRLHAFTGGSQSPLSPENVSVLLKEVEHSNELVKLFHTSRDLMQSNEATDFYIRLYDCHNTPCYDMPSNNCIEAIVTDNEPMSDGFNIVISSKGVDPKRISKLHSLYMPLQYPLLFIHGESGWSPKMLCNTDAMTEN